MASRRTIRAKEAQLAFEALSIEGGLLSPEWLSKVAQLSAGSQTEADYRIPKGLNLRDEIGRYWRIAQAHWKDFAAGSAAKADPAVVAERFLTAVLKESFGFESLVKVEPVVLSERHYPIGHSALGQRVPVVVAPAGSGIDTLSPTYGDHGRRRSPFGLAQEYLNGFEGALWGIVTDGCTLRILRDNASLTRPAWIEADLARIFTEERYADFAALWLLLHETRFGRDGQAVTECALETWRNAGKEEGTRAREHLRNGVEEALVALGQGFLAHPENKALRTALQDGSLSTRDYFNQLLRLVYRLIFLLTVEERNLLHPEGTPDAARSLYADGYSLRRLREKALKRSAHDRFADLWQSTKVAFRGLAAGETRLGLPALAGIFATSQCPALDAAKLENRALLLAVFKLAWLRDAGALARVNWRDMGPEELGSVYESLLELVPQISKEGRQFGFASGDETKGNARKTTGSYYTPDSLVQVLLDSALEPVIADTIRGVERVASGEWRVVPEHLRAAFISYANQQLSGSRGLAEGASVGKVSLSSHSDFSQGGALRNDLSDSAGLDLDPGQHSGRMGPSLSGGVHSVSADREREPDRTGNPPDPQRGRGHLPTGSGSATAPGNGNTGQAASGTGAKPATEAELESFWRTLPFAIRHSLLAQQALLSLSIVDPACGSGHFLLAAARRLASHVARLQANGTPSGAQYRHALRQVVGHCIYGVDLNPMAVELCKVSLWMEAVEPGLPLTFLNSHIQHGNALLGTTPELMAKGIPDAAWEPIEGDDRKVASALKKRNKQGATGQRSLDTLWSQPGDTGAQAIVNAVTELEATSDADAAQLAKKEGRWGNILKSDEYRKQKFIADAWCAAFVWPKNPGPLAEIAPTNELWRQIRDGRGKAPAFTITTVEELANRYCFFQWHLQFPHVFAKGGFDLVVGNPPWERVKVQTEEWMTNAGVDLSATPNAAARNALLEELMISDQSLRERWNRARRQAETLDQFVRHSGKYLRTAAGDVNSYALFAELAVGLLGGFGFAALVLPIGIITDKTYAGLCGQLMNDQRLRSVIGFVNEEQLFADVMHNFKFVVFLVGPPREALSASFVFGLLHPAELPKARTQRGYEITAEDVAALNPNTLTCPVFLNGNMAKALVSLHRRLRSFAGSGWNVKPHAMLHMGSASKHFLTAPTNAGTVPLYESKMVNRYNHRFATFESLAVGERAHMLPRSSPEQLTAPEYEAKPGYFYPVVALPDIGGPKVSWLLVFRRIANPALARTSAFCVLPRIAVGDSLNVVVPQVETTNGKWACDAALLCWLGNSVVFDAILKQKMGGNNFSEYVWNQLPVPRRLELETPVRWLGGVTPIEFVVPRVCELSVTSYSVVSYAIDLGFAPHPFRWDNSRRRLAEAELDASAAMAFGLSRQDFETLFDAFPVLMEREVECEGEFVTRALALSIYDAMADAFHSGQLYQTRMDPPPADPSCCHPPRTSK